MGSWHPGMIALEEEAKQRSHVLFFVIDNQTRAIASTVEAAYLSASQRLLVLIVNKLHTPQSLSGDTLPRSECEELARTRDCLVSLVDSCKMPTYYSVPEALNCLQEILRDVKHPNTRSIIEDTPPSSKTSKSPQPRKGKSEDRRTTFTKAPSTSPRPNSDCFRKKDSCRDESMCPSVKSKLVRLLSRAAEHFTPSFGDRRSAQQSPKLRSMTSLTPTAVNKTTPQHAENARSNTGGDLSAQISTWTLATAASSLTKTDVCIIADISAIPSLKQTAAVQLAERGISVKLTQVDGRGDDNCQLPPARQLQLLSENTRCILFVISAEAACSRLLTLAAHCVGVQCCAGSTRQRCKLVLSVQNMSSQSAATQLSEAAIKDYNRGRSYLTDVAQRAKITVTDTSDTAISTIISLLTPTNCEETPTDLSDS